MYVLTKKVVFNYNFPILSKFNFLLIFSIQHLSFQSLMHILSIGVSQKEEKNVNFYTMYFSGVYALFAKN